MRKSIDCGAGLAGLLMLATLALTGCQSAPPNTGAANDFGSETLRVGDPLIIIFSDTPPPPMLPFETRIKEDGTVTLIYDQSFLAAGRSRGDLEREIRARYVPAYFANLTATIKPQDRFYYVEGEVRYQSRQEYRIGLTVLQAIASAQGFTDFANQKKVRLTRQDGKTEIINCIKARQDPRLDRHVYPGDKIHVPRKWL